MSRRPPASPQKIFWIIVALATVVGVAVFSFAAVNLSPQAATTTIMLKINKGVIVYADGATPDDTHENISINKVVGTTETPLVSGIKHSQQASTAIAKVNRTYSNDTAVEVDFGATIRVRLYFDGASPKTGCFSTITIPAKTALLDRSRIQYTDDVFKGDIPPALTLVKSIDRIHADCGATTSPAPSPTSTATATPTSNPTSTATATATVRPTATATTGDPVAVPFQPVFCSDHANQYDTLIVADASGSMDDHGADAMLKAFVARAVAQNKVRVATDRLGLITYSEPTVLRAPFSTDFAITRDKVNGMTFQAGASDIAKGVAEASKQLRATRRSATTPIIVIVLSDNQGTMAALGKTLADQDSSLYLARYFGVSLGGRNTSLVELARSGRGSYINIANTASVNTAVDSLFSRIDSLAKNCATFHLSATPAEIVSGEDIIVSFSLTNHTRDTISHAVGRQPVPAGLTGELQSGALVVNFPDVASGQTVTQTATLRGVNE